MNDCISNKSIILASKSPRRKELLSRIVDDFIAVEPTAKESLPCKMEAADAVKFLASIKARSIAEKYSGIIIGADTLVVLNDDFLGKPINHKNAEEILNKLSGKVHQVYTGVCVIDTAKNVELCEFECTDVYFDTISSIDIQRYIMSEEPMDKAGAYAIQGQGGKFIKKINGCYYNVVGLPLNLLSKMLKKIELGGQYELI